MKGGKKNFEEKTNLKAHEHRSDGRAWNIWGGKKISNKTIKWGHNYQVSATTEVITRT
jgi:hypothetical protein